LKRFGLLRLSTCIGVLVIALVSTSHAQSPVQWTVGMHPAHPVDTTWLDNLQMGSVRIGSCSAALVTATGLLATGYECAHRHVRSAWRVEHVPLDSGFYAQDLFEERRVPALFADHLLHVSEATATALPDTTWEQDGGRFVREVRPVADSTHFLAYTYQRYDDVRVVMMPERAVATFGGDHAADIYPRYGLAFAFLRVYDAEGGPVVTEKYLPFSTADIIPGAVLYSIGFADQVPEISSGTAAGYAYNGTRAPPHTTLFGLYDLHYSHRTGSAWHLPAPWLAARRAMDLSTQLNAAVTAPCTPNGAPVISIDLELQGVAYDQTATAEGMRCIVVTAAGIYEALRTRYDAVPLLYELEEEGLDEYAP